MNMPEAKITITVLVNDEPVSESFAASIKVEEVIKRLLPPGEKDKWSNYEIRDTNGGKLDPATSLADNGVEDGDRLSLNKSEGGGG
jgi:WXG100 protein secretion system (Wss), protein YukD